MRPKVATDDVLLTVRSGNPRQCVCHEPFNQVHKTFRKSMIRSLFDEINQFNYETLEKHQQVADMLS